jgi:transposase-like protein
MKVQCPCCKGTRVLEVWDEEEGRGQHFRCTHCEGTGTVEAEDRYLVDDDPD